MGHGPRVAALDRRTGALRTRRGRGRPALSARDRTVRERRRIAPRAGVGWAGSSGGATVSGPADGSSDAAHVGARRIHQAAAFGARWLGLRPHPRRRRTLSRTSTTLPARSVDVSPTRALGACWNRPAHPGRGSVPPSLDRRRLVGRTRYRFDVDRARNLLRGNPGRPPSIAPASIHVLLAGDEALGGS